MAVPSLTVRDGNNAAQTISSLTDLAGNNSYSVTIDNGRQTYRAAANFTPQVTGAVTLVSLQGSATKTVRITRIGMSGISTGGGDFVAALQKTSALGAGGTTVTPTVSKLDSASAAATAVVQHYTTTLKATGTAIGGPLSAQNVTTIIPVATYAVDTTMLWPEKGVPCGQNLVLRGVAEFMEIQNLAPTNLVAGTVLSYFIEWVEDGS